MPAIRAEAKNNFPDAGGKSEQMRATAASSPGDVRASTSRRWWQLIIGIICMSMIANLQYGWTLFVNPINR